VRLARSVIDSANLWRAATALLGVHLEHKFQIVQVLKNRGWRTDMTGDGVKNALGLKTAGVGITDAAQGVRNRSHQSRAFSHCGSY